MTWNSEFGFLTYLFTCVFLLICGFLLFLLWLGADGVGVEDREAIGVFLFATGSAMDEMLGVSPSGSVMEMGGGNGTGDAGITMNGTGDAVIMMNGTGDTVMTMNGTGDAVMEDVEVAKSRR